MLERLIEHWLDSASERSYQRCFCQMLTGRGYRVVHNTEHTPLEFGKDVIAISPDGKVVGYQLKGNPGSTLKPYDFDKIRGQLEQLATLALTIPGLNEQVPDECYLVTNGEIDEAVYQQLLLLNTALKARGHCPDKIKTITRGTLLDWAIELGLALWPSEVEDFGNLVRLLNYSGDEMFPAQLFDNLLQHTLQFQKPTKRLELRRRITSAAILTAIGLNQFAKRNNHFAEITAWTMFCTYTISICEKNEQSFDECGRDATEMARQGILDLLAQLCGEAVGRGTLVEGDPLSDFAFYRPRVLLIYALMGIYWMWSEAEGWIYPTHKAAIEQIVKPLLPRNWLWGEAAISNFMTYIWYRWQASPDPELDSVVASVLRALMDNKLAEKGHLPSPYYTPEDVARHAFASILQCEDPLSNDGFERDSYVCEGLMSYLVHADLKEICQSLWPDFTRINHEQVVPDESWRYGLYRTGEGATNVTRIYPSAMTWNELKSLTTQNVGAGIPAALKGDRYLLLLFINIFPFRASLPAIKLLMRQPAVR